MLASEAFSEHLPLDTIEVGTPEGVIAASVLYIVQDDELLLAEKARGFAKGKLNGPGGKKSANESIAETTSREAQEELGIVPVEPRLAAAVSYPNVEGGARMDVFFSICNSYEGDIRVAERPEMIDPRWYPLNDLPWDRMHYDNRFWLPAALSGAFVAASVAVEEVGVAIDFSAPPHFSSRAQQSA